MECEFLKLGCTSKLSNSDHAQAHSVQCAPQHLRLLSTALDAVINDNKSLNQKVQALSKTVKDYETKFGEYDAKLKEAENRASELARIQPNPGIVKVRNSTMDELNNNC